MSARGRPRVRPAHGTENVPYVAGLGAAAEIARAHCQPPPRNFACCATACGIACTTGWAIKLFSMAIPTSVCRTRSTLVSSAMWGRTARKSADRRFDGIGVPEGSVSQSPVLCAMAVRRRPAAGRYCGAVGRSAPRPRSTKRRRFWCGRLGDDSVDKRDRRIEQPRAGQGQIGRHDEGREHTRPRGESPGLEPAQAQRRAFGIILHSQVFDEQKPGPILHDFQVVLEYVGLEESQGHGQVSPAAPRCRSQIGRKLSRPLRCR